MESTLFKSLASAITAPASNQPAEAWIYRDDIGAPLGIKGYEE
jgi:hypothetical protein